MRGQFVVLYNEHINILNSICVYRNYNNSSEYQRANVNYGIVGNPIFAVVTIFTFSDHNVRPQLILNGSHLLVNLNVYLWVHTQFLQKHYDLMIQPVASLIT